MHWLRFSAVRRLGTLGGLALLIPLYWGLLQLAGSMRTNEMMTALRTKRDFDRTARRYRSTFEDMQLEFHHVKNFSQWWEGVCRAAHRLEFINVTLKLPAAENLSTTNESEREREFTWTTDCPNCRFVIPSSIHTGDGYRLRRAQLPPCRFKLRHSFAGIRWSAIGTILAIAH